MQLKRPASKLRVGVVAASCALLSGTARAQSAQGAGEPVALDSALLYYKENAERVQVIEPVVNLKYDFGDERILGGSFTADTMSGATPNGALPALKPQTFASPSSRSLVPHPGEKTTLYTIAPGNLPDDPHFREQRFAGDLDWSHPLGLDNNVNYGAHLSSEHDFNSAAAHAGLSHDFNGKNTTISTGINEEYDQIHPNGGTPVPGSEYALYEHEGHQSKTVSGALLGVAQVMARNWIADLNYTLDRSHGYLTDPYRILSVLDALGNVTDYRYENRPGSRTRQSLYFVNKVALARAVIDLSYRRGKDNWGINSDTVEAHVRIDLGRGMYVEPLARWYHQGAADFYDLYLRATAAPFDNMSADPRLAAFVATTVGLKFGATIGRYGELSLRLEEYDQKPTDQASALPGLQGLDLNPNLKATIAELSWGLQF